MSELRTVRFEMQVEADLDEFGLPVIREVWVAWKRFGQQKYLDLSDFVSNCEEEGDLKSAVLEKFGLEIKLEVERQNEDDRVFYEALDKEFDDRYGS
jgi:hypothetical protein